MKLYTMPGACSLSCHIALEESGLPFEAIVAARDDAKLWDEIERLNPMGKVPVLVLDDGSPLLQNVAILTHIAEKAPQKALLEAPATVERARTLQWASWVGADLHKAYGPLFMGASEADQTKARATIQDLLGIADRHLAGKAFLGGDRFSIADAYLFVVYGWAGHVGVPTDAFKNLQAYAARVAARPAVQAAMKREGLA